ncbi:MAG: hypothetical protein ACLQVN_12410 [Bryobacteraceae bacterium]
MISCKNVAKLLMSDQLQTQSWWKRLEVRLHLAMCGLCSRLARQLEQLRSGVRQMSGKEAGPDFEERLIRRLSGR